MESVDRPVLRSRVWLVAASLLAGLGFLLLATGTNHPVGTAVILTTVTAGALTVVAWALVNARRQRRAYEDKLTAWAAERAAQAERLRIARELHDLASHGLGLITVRAAAARTVTGAAGDTERIAALTDIERAGRQATTELRRMLAVLRGPGDEPPLRPAETLDDLPRILDAARSGGVTVTCALADLGEVSASTQLAVCAVVREALANTARHAGPSRAHVTVAREQDAIVVTVTDDGPVPGWMPHSGAGMGLASLHERVSALGGVLHAGRAGRGYRVTARLPEPTDQAEYR
ncbi:MAG TPA: histidine kinase [Natronosporangium sp.]|nr:histidine kinase [Natronosporangium sp.]